MHARPSSAAALGALALLAITDLLSAQASPVALAELKYYCIGPTRGGRVTTVTGVAAQPGTFFLGATGGGVWKTTDYGEIWRNVSDGFFATGSIGAIRVAPSNPDVVYVGTGSDALRSNVITGRGVYKSTDAGKTWAFVGLRDVGQIGAVEIHPDDPDIAFVAAIGDAFQPTPARGVYRTVDGGATWTKVLFVADTVGCCDLEFAPDNPREIYASLWRGERKPWTIISGGDGGGVYKSEDGGTSWRRLTIGLPKSVIGKSDLAVSAADPDRVYALIEAGDQLGGLYRSDDRGEVFYRVSDRQSLIDRPFYYTNVDADPSDADVVYVNSTGASKSTDGGATWRSMRTPHGDNHDLWIHPGDSKLMIQSNDGGANVSRDGGATWSTQRNQPTAELYQVAVDDRYPYWVYAGQQDSSTVRLPSRPTGGFNASNYQSVGGCETGPAIPKPGDPDIVYTNCKGCFGVYNARTGQEKQYYVGGQSLYGHDPDDLKYRFQRVAPIHVSPHDRNVVYHGSQYVHRTTDDGVTWTTISPDLTAHLPEHQVVSGGPITRDITGEEYYSTLYAIAESKLERGLIWVGANDGPIHVTRDDGATWTNVTPAELPPGGRVQTVEPSPHRAGKAYVSVLRYQLGDWQPHVYRTADYGATWTRLTNGRNGIPADEPTRVVREDPEREGLLYCGTEFGMWVSFDDGASWHSLQLNLPHVPVTDLVVHRGDVVLSTMGRSFWILDNITPLRQTATAVPGDVVLFTPRPAYRQRGSGFGGFGGGFGGANAAVGSAATSYPPTGAAIDYWLPTDVDAATLEIVDAKGKVVQRFGGAEASATTPPTDTAAAGDAARAQPRGQGTGRPGRGATRNATATAGAPDEPADDEDMAQFFRSRFGGSRAPVKLAMTAGAHRLVWDLGTSQGAGQRGRATTAVPGTYTARLTVGTTVRTARLEIVVDPRLAAEGVTAEDLVEQAALLQRIAEATARAEATAASARRARDQLAAKVEAGDAAAVRVDAELREILDAVVTPRGPERYLPAKLIGQLGYLSGMVGGADQKPGRDAYERLAELEAQHQALRTKLQSVVVREGLETVR